MKKLVALFLCVLLCLSAVGCASEGNNSSQDTPSSSEASSQTSSASESSSTPVEEEETSSAPSSPASAPEDIEPVETSIDSPAQLGQWVEATRYSAVDKAYHTVYCRITNVVRGAQDEVDAYNAEDHVVVLSDLEDENLEYCMIEYEVYFPEDFPQQDYGITSVDMNFSVQSPDGGGIEFNGSAYIGLSTVWDISEAPEINEFYAGQTFTEGKAIFAMVKGVSDYVFELSYQDSNEESHAAYFQGQ